VPEPLFTKSENGVWFDDSNTELCLLPFPTEEIFLPGMMKTLYLYEARYISLLEATIAREDKMFLHTIVQSPWEEDVSECKPSLGAFVGLDFALCCNTAAQIVKVERMQTGALVHVMGEGRAAISSLVSQTPYISGMVELLKDATPADEPRVLDKAEELKAVAMDVLDLGMRFDELSRDCMKDLQNALAWSQNDSEVKLSETDDLQLEQAARLSFAVLNIVPEASEADKLRLNRARVDAMSTLDTEERLDIALLYASEMRSMLAAKVALMDLKL